MKFFFNGLVALGILFGVLLVISFEFFTDFFGTSIEPSGELMAAILGASIGWAGTVLTIHASVEARVDEQSSRDQAVAAEIFVKFQSIVNSLYHLRKHMRDSYAAVDRSLHENPGLFVLSLTGHPDLVHFSAEEKALYIRHKKVEAANDISEWDEIHNSLIRAFEKYAYLREGFMEAVPATMNGMVGTTELSEEEYLRIAPKIAQLNDLAAQLRERAERDYAEAKLAMTRVKNEMEALCKLKLNLSFPE